MADEEPKGEQASTPSADELLEAKLAALDEKVKAAGNKRMPDVPDWNYKRENKPEKENLEDGHRSLGIGMTAAYALLGGMVFGFGVGWLIDRFAHTAPLWQAAGSMAGVVLGLIYVIVLANRESN